jgi:glycosyltransferase involved in cell wall biosynthesis
VYGGETVGVVVPAYNEEGFIGDVIDTMPRYVDRIYLVDDGSTDGTWEEIQHHVSELPPEANSPPTDTPFDRRFVPIQHEQNRGAGAALKTGYKRALADGIGVTAVMAGDGQMNPDILHCFLEPIVDGDVDYTKGNRLHDSELREETPTVRFVGSLLLTFLTRVASGYWTMRDSQNGYTAISLDALEAIDLDELVDGFGTPNELLTRLNAHDMPIADVPMPANYGDEESHLQYRTYIWWMSALLLRNFVWRLRRKYLVERTHPLPFCYVSGVASIMVGLGWGFVTLWKWPIVDTIPYHGLVPVGFFLIGGLFLTIAMLFDKWENTHLELQPT